MKNIGTVFNRYSGTVPVQCTAMCTGTGTNVYMYLYLYQSKYCQQ